MMIKNRDYKLNHESTYNIKCCSQYKYLGINIDDHGRIPIENQTAIQRSDYLRSKLKYYVQHLSVQN